MATKNYTVDEKFIKDAHKAACGEWKVKMEKKFPEVFKSSLFEFGLGDAGFRLTTASSPLVIGAGLAPAGKEGKCLVVSEGYVMKVTNIFGRQILEFTRK
jgi:hypothetical protein